MKAQVGERITNSETVLLFRRALRYVAPFKFRFLVKMGLMIVSLLPLLILPWPIKIFIDHVIGQIPISEKVASYPFFVRPFASFEPSCNGFANSSTSMLCLVTICFVQSTGSVSTERPLGYQCGSFHERPSSKPAW